MLRIANADGKVWMMPVRHLRTALALYQPSGWRGKLLRRCLPLFWRVPMLRKGMHVELTTARLTDTVEAAISEAFGKGKEYAVFLGTPCAHQKATVQVAEGDRILGYCKLTDNPAVKALFLREMALLRDLSTKGVSGIPKALACDTTDDGIDYFAQTTAKTRRSAYPHHWGMLHERFVNDLHEKTRTTLPYADTDFASAIKLLRQRLTWTDERQQRIIGHAIDSVENGLTGNTEWSAYHADFTPWNMLVEKGELFVFDWEYALRSCPPMLDRYHFFTQTEIFEKHHSIDEIEKEFEKKAPTFKYFNYLCYLLLNVSIYIGRETPETIGNIDNALKTWTALIKWADDRIHS